MTPAELARLGTAVADILDDRGNPGASGVIRQLAALVITQATELDLLRPSDAPCCPQCAAPVIQATTGRPRVYCSAKCRRRAHRDATGRNERLAS